MLQAVEKAQKLQDDRIKFGTDHVNLYVEDVEGDWLETWDDDEESRLLETNTCQLDKNGKTIVRLGQMQEQLNSQAVSTQSSLFGAAMATAGKLELTIKINEFPDNVKTVENNWKQFEVDCDGQIATIKVKPKVFKKLEDAQANYPMWVAAIVGKMGEATPNGFVLAEPNIQVFEKKPKEPKDASEVVATAT